jgi:hypothetical protein
MTIGQQFRVTTRRERHLPAVDESAFHIDQPYILSVQWREQAVSIKNPGRDMMSQTV